MSDVIPSGTSQGQGRTILLYNPISGHGHLDSWNALFVDFLLEAGWKVASLGPGAEDLRLRLARKELSQHPKLTILEWRQPKRSLSQRIRAKLVFWSERLNPKPKIDSDATQRRKELESSYLQPQEFAERIVDAAVQLGHRPVFVFNMYMDLYRNDAEGWQPFAEINKIPWAGIRFVPSPAPPSEAYYFLRSLAGMCFLDESVEHDYSVQLPHMHFAYLPDVTDSSVPSSPSDLALQIKREAGERKIVFMGGTIASNKNLSEWYKLIALANPTKWFFVQLGEVHEQNLSPDDLLAYRQIRATKPENVLIYSEYVSDERIFNEVIALSDVVFAVYRRFSISSNMLGKAAVFNKPILVADGYLMGDRVNKYQIGLAVAENDPKMMCEALDALTQPLPDRQIAHPEHFAQYRHDFSHNALKAKLFGFLDIVSTGPMFRTAKSTRI